MEFVDRIIATCLILVLVEALIYASIIAGLKHECNISAMQAHYSSAEIAQICR